MKNTAPVFIGGAGRSGTTLVVDVLGLHPRLSPIYETHFVLKLGMLFFRPSPLPIDTLRNSVVNIMNEWTAPLPHRPHTKREHERFYHGPHYILFDRQFAKQQTMELLDAITQRQAVAGFRTFISNLFAEHCQLDGKPRWINKTPDYVQFLPILYVLFPDMRFIHCIRDGRDTACSAMTRPWGPKTVSHAAQWWTTQALSGVQFGQAHPTQYLEVFYENIVHEPVEQLSHILAWLGEEDHAAAIIHQYQQGDISVDNSRIGEWKKIWSADELRDFNERAGPTLAHFHYD